MAKHFVLLLFISFVGQSLNLELKNRAYEGLTIKISEDVPFENCRQILENLQASLTSASQYLFSALDSKAYIRSATVLLPSSWPESCHLSAVMSGSGETSDITLLPRASTRGTLWTQQSVGCGQNGDQIYLAHETLLKRNNNLGRSLVKEFAMYRYGVFEEQGYYNDPIYPMCYYDDKNKKGKVTGCSDVDINDNGICSGDTDAIYNTTEMIDKNARSSIMFAPEAHSVYMFCDSGNHDRIAPTKHNLICQRRSILDVIMSHSDFTSFNNTDDMNSHQITDTTPKISYKKQRLTRYVFVIESTKDMVLRESWNYLKLAIQQWLFIVLPNNTEAGLVLTEEGRFLRRVNLVPSTYYDKLFSALPFTPGDSMNPGCIHCGIKDAINMLNERTKLNGAANNIIIVIAPGIDGAPQIDTVLQDAKKSKIKIASINYPNVIRNYSLNSLAEKTNGAAYTVFEQKLNVDDTLLTSYFELINVLRDISTKYYSGNKDDQLVEIHRREITDDGRSSITGSFMLDPNMGEPAKFVFYTHNSQTPLIKSISLISPSHQEFSEKNMVYIHLKMLQIYANISEPGTWTYTVEPYPGNPQPHFLQVLATPKSSDVPVLRSHFWTHRNKPGDPLILLTQVKLGEMPVLGAKVEVTVTKSCNPCNHTNSGMSQKYKFELLDSGSGDPDITKGDGVYTRYFSAAEGGVGFYTFEIVVTDNGNTAYSSSSDGFKIPNNKPCCGSTVPPSGVQPITPFQRVLPKQTVYISSEDILAASQTATGRIGDMRVEVIPEDMKARLSWTSPDMGGNSVSRYEVRYAQSVEDIIDNFETKAVVWNNGQPFPLVPGSETSFNLDMSQSKELLDKPMYFAIKAYSKMSSDVPGTISNWVRVLVPSPPPPPTVAPSYNQNDQYWPNNANSEGADPVSPSIAKKINIGLELILPVVIGIILLAVLLLVYCYFCVVKRRDRGLNKNGSKPIKNDKLSSNITIVPSSPQHNPLPTYISDSVDSHNIGLPVNNFGYEEETKKRYSLVNQQEQQLIEELKQQQQHMGHRDNTYGGVSVISNSLGRNGHTLSPYNSWTASQLLHAHERRHSPMENMPEEQLTHDLMMAEAQLDHMSINGQNLDHVSLNGHHMTPQMVDHYQQTHLPPPVPPLPLISGNGYPVNYNIYGTHQVQNHQIYQPLRNEPVGAYNPSLQGSLSSVNSGEKKRRNVTMV